MSKSTPAAPDYTAAAQAQGQSSQNLTEQQTVANRPTINTPFGQQSWDLTPIVDPTTGQTVSSWTMNTNLTPQTQAALDSQMAIQKNKSQTAQGLLGQFDQEANTPMDWSKVTPLASTPNTTGINKQAQDASWGAFENMNEPLMTQQKNQLDTQLQNQGLKSGDEAYDTAMKNLENQQSQAREQASYGAVLTGNQVGQAQFGENLQGANFQNQTRQQQIAEDLQQRGFTLNEINSILNGSQVGLPATPGFATAGAGQPVQALNAATQQYGAAVDAANVANQQTAGTETGIGSLALAALMYY